MGTPLGGFSRHCGSAAQLLIPLVLACACFALAPQLRAVCQDACLTNDNTVQGDDALISLTTGIDNTAVGFNAIKSTTTGQANTAIGSQTLVNNTTGGANTATGTLALQLNTTGADNTANGVFALQKNTSGSDNTAVGLFAAFNNTIGTRNTVSGSEAFFSNTRGSSNTANGADALGSNTTGNANTAIGSEALVLNTTGNSNIAVGINSGANLTTGDKNIEIGNVGVAGESNTIRIGKTGNQMNTFIAGISGAIVPTGVPVIVDNSGHLGTTTSSARFKEEIEPMDKESEAILSLQPVRFRYRHDLDPEGIPQFGLVAEEVEKVNPKLVVRDNQGKPYSVRYEAVNAMLLNEFLKEHRRIGEQERRVQQQDTTITELRSQVQTLTKALKEQAAEIQKVTDEVRTSSPQAGSQLIASKQ